MDIYKNIDRVMKTSIMVADVETEIHKYYIDKFASKPVSDWLIKRISDSNIKNFMLL